MATTSATDPAPGALAGKVAVVIGGGRGIGRATARKLASAQAHVVIASRTASELEAVSTEIAANGGRATAFPVDVTRVAEVEALADSVRRAHERVDVLVYSAGVSLIAPLDATSETDWDRVMATNLKGAYLCIRAMLDLLRAAEGGAQVVNIASKVGLTGHALVSAYAAAKAGFIGFSRSLADELSGDNIRVLTICPGPVDTPMRWAATPDMDPKLTITAETVADTILFLLSLDCRTTVDEIVIEALAYDESAISLVR